MKLADFLLRWRWFWTGSAVMGVLMLAIQAYADPAADRVDLQAAAAAQGLQGVARLAETAGADTTPKLTPARDCALLPGGCGSIWQIHLYLPSTGTYALKDWDFTGYTVRARGTAVVSCANCKFAGGGVGQHQLLVIGVDSGAGTAQFTCEACSFDYAKTTTLNESGVLVWGIGRFANSRFETAPQDFITQAGATSALTVTGSYFRRWGQASAPAAHLEPLHAFAGRLLFTGNFVDGRDGKGPGVTSGCTGLIFPNAERGGGGGPITWTVSGNLLLGAKAHQCPMVVQFGDGGGTNVGVFSGNAMDRPTSVYVSAQGGAKVTGERNVDLDTGKAVVLPATAP